MKVEIYSDIACPWCYIGKRRFEAALEAFASASDVEVVHRPFLLDPAAPDTPVPMPLHLEKKFGALAKSMLGRVTDAAAAEGITMDWDAALAANTRNAHRLARLARTEYGPEVQRRLMDELYAAYFTSGIDISDAAELAAIAGAAGMDEARAREYLASDEGEAELEAELVRAREIGVTAVPTFVFDGQYAVPGAQPADTFLEVLEEVRRRAA